MCLTEFVAGQIWVQEYPIPVWAGILTGPSLASMPIAVCGRPTQGLTDEIQSENHRGP